MEVFPVDNGHELLPQPDLLAAYADREVSIFGITGTFKDLAAMCPIDLNDPRITLANKNEFIVKAANEAGIEVEPEHEDIFKRVTEQFGLERKFTVANTVLDPSVDKVIVHAQIPVEPKTVNVGKTDQRQEQKSLPVSETNSQEVGALHEELQRSLLDRKADLGDTMAPSKAAAPAKKIDGSKVEQATDQPIEKLPTTGAKTSGVIAKLIKSTQAQSAPSEPALTDIDERLGNTTAVDHSVSIAEVAAVNVKADILDDAQFVGQLEKDPGTDDLIKSNWEAMLSQDPLEVFEDFTEALAAFAELMSPSTVVDVEVDPESSGLQSEPEIGEVPPVPPIMTTIIERLSELETDEKMVVAPILKNIIGAIHGLELLDQRGAEPELMAAVKVQLRELCLALFEALAVDYTDLDVEQFLELMLQPNFQPAQPNEEALDLEHMGTREVKWHFPSLSTTLADMVESELHRMLGMFAVVSARTEA